MKLSWIVPHTLAASSMPFDGKDILSLHEQGIRAMVSLTGRSLIGLSDITTNLFETLDIPITGADLIQTFKENSIP